MQIFAQFRLIFHRILVIALGSDIQIVSSAIGESAGMSFCAVFNFRVDEF